MRFGFCTDFAASTRTAVDYDLLRRIKKAGYDFAEFPLMLIESLSEEAFEEMVSGMKEIGLSNDVCCNFFPERVRLTGPDADHGVIRDYLERAMGRAHRLGTKKIVFGSCPARNLPEGVSEEEGYQQLTAVLKECVIPLCAKYDILIVMEAIYSGPCNFIITLPEAMELVRRVNSPYVAMLADTMHMAYNAEDPQYLYQCYSSLNHVHVAEKDRILPEDGYSQEVSAVLKILEEKGYDKTISFEAKGGTGPESMGKALRLLKAQLS